MKCISCGGEIGLNDERCPYCGRILTETAGHRAGMKNYRKRTEKAKQGASKAVSSNMPIVISAVVMVILLTAICIALYVKDNAYTFRSDAMRKESVKKYREYSTEIKKYLEAEDYTGFAAFKEYHNIAEWEAPYDDLKLLWEMADDYNALVSSIESAVMFGEDADWYNPDSYIHSIRRAIDEFYYEYDHKQNEIESDPYAVYIRDMKDKADIILRVYLGLDDAAREEYLESSDIHREAYLEEVLINE